MSQKETYKTGGGSYSPRLQESEALILAMLEEQRGLLSNPYDSAADYCGW